MKGGAFCVKRSFIAFKRCLQTLLLLRISNAYVRLAACLCQNQMVLARLRQTLQQT